MTRRPWKISKPTRRRPRNWAKKNDYDGAQKRLVLLRQLAEVQTNSPPGGLTSKTLKPLQHQWQATVKKFTADFKALENAILDECKGKPGQAHPGGN